MKIKLYFLFIIVINLFMVACSNNQNMLVGKWKLVNTSSPQRMNKSLEKGLIWEFCEDIIEYSWTESQLVNDVL